MKMKQRNAIEKDAMFVWRLRNSPDVRKVSLNKENIKWKDHKGYFKAHIKEYEIVLQKKYRIGYLRNQGGYISIALIDECRGKGLGSEILKQSKGKAIILKENEASIKAFKKAGYKVRGYYLEK